MDIEMILKSDDCREWLYVGCFLGAPPRDDLSLRSVNLWPSLATLSVHVPINQQPTLSPQGTWNLASMFFFFTWFHGKYTGTHGFTPQISKVTLEASEKLWLFPHSAWAGCTRCIPIKYLSDQAHGQSFRAVAKMLMTHSYKAWVNPCWARLGLLPF